MPKVTVIIPVYNVEKYIHECLNSVVNQTLADIQIICVDDGSPDNCPQILDDYAAKDTRITVIHQKNAGISAARNAAYPYIKGEYTLFVDSDDSVKPDLCEKAVTVADDKQADMTCFFSDRSCPIRKFVGKHLFEEIDKATLLSDSTVWSKLWRSRFLLGNNIQSPEGQYVEDHFIQWKALIHNPKRALIPEIMYYYRTNPTSAVNEPSQKYIMGLPGTYDLIKTMLVETGNYHGEWKSLFLRRKLEVFYATYAHLPMNRKIEYCRIVKERLGAEEIEFLLHDKKIKRKAKVFHRSLLGSRLAVIESSIYTTLRSVEIGFRILRDKWVKN